jgi:hypothetical protein
MNLQAASSLLVWRKAAIVGEKLDGRQTVQPRAGSTVKQRWAEQADIEILMTIGKKRSETR